MEDPARSGWNWTLAPDIAPEEQEEERAEELDALKGVEGIEDIGVISFAQVRAAGERMTGVAMGAEQGAPSFTVVNGRMPSGPREVAVGPKTAEQLGLAIGDSVSLADPDLPDGGREAVVVGEVLVPTQDDNAFNEGVVLTPDALAAVAETEGSIRSWSPSPTASTRTTPPSECEPSSRMPCRCTASPHRRLTLPT